MSDEITLAANNLFSFAALFALTYRFKWWISTGPEDKATRAAILSWTLLEVSVLIRIGWWALALAFAPESSVECAPQYNQWFVENKHYVSTLSSVLYLWGTLSFIRMAENYDFVWKIKVAVMLVLMAALSLVAGI